MDSPILEARGLTKAYGLTRAISDINLSISEGEVLAVLGPSGAGKTTLLMCLALLEPPTAGTILFRGKEIYSSNGMKRVQQNRAKYAEGCGFVFQNFYLWPHMTALQNVAEALITVKGMPKDQAYELSTIALRSVNVLHRKDARPENLSGGEIQRVAIARALVQDPKILFLDEITSNIDPENVYHLLLILESLAKDRRTLIMVTHHINLAKRLSNRALFMEAGNVLEIDETKRFFKEPTHARTRQFLEELTLGGI